MKENEQEEQNQRKVQTLDINEMKFISPLGRGAKGVVFHVQMQDYHLCECDQEDYALKVVLKSAIKCRGEGKESNSRVSFEVQVLRELDHPLLPRLNGVIETEEIIGYAIDYCPGGNLNSLRKQQVEKMFSDDVIRFYGCEMVLALEYLHNKGIVYRDLKPENVLIQENGHLMLVDFDLSTKLVPKSPVTVHSRPSYELTKKPSFGQKKTHKRILLPFCKSGISPEDDVDSVNSVDESTESDSVGKSNSFVGTEEYVAPEIILGNGHDFAVDWWCYGAVLYEMLYGKTPFKGQNRKETFYRILTKEPELVGETTPLRDLIRKLLEKDPKKRITLEEIKGHDFFKGVDWDLIVRLPRPPYIPVRPNVVDSIGGIKDVESIVHGIFKKEDVNKNISGNSENKTCEDNKKSCIVDKETMNRGAWVEGLNQPSLSGNFLVF